MQNLIDARQDVKKINMVREIGSLNMLKDKTGKVLSRSEGEAIMKSRSSVVISVCAALLAMAAMLSNSNSSRILNDTLAANDTWAFYQSKSIKQEIKQENVDSLEDELQTLTNSPAVQSRRDAIEAKIAKDRALIARYETDPDGGEGKKELALKARGFENDRVLAKNRSSWFGAASAALQIAIVLASSSILAVSMPMLVAGAIIGFLGTGLLLNAIFMFVTILL